MDISEIIKSRRSVIGVSQAELAEATGISVRQLARYEAGEQQPAFSVAVQLADALGISLAELAGQVSHELDLSGIWWAGWSTSKEGVPRIDTHTLEVNQRGDVLHLEAERAIAVEDGSYRWRGEFRLWDNEALMGWYRSTDAAVRSKGVMYLSLHTHGTYAWGQWVGKSYDGEVMNGWGAIARSQDRAHDIIESLVTTGEP